MYYSLIQRMRSFIKLFTVAANVGMESSFSEVSMFLRIPVNNLHISQMVSGFEEVDSAETLAIILT